MLKLFKYELRKTMMSKLILLGLTAVLEGYFLYGIFSKNADAATMAALLLTAVAVFGVIFIGIQSIVTLHHDMNTKQSYMLFMTPNSNYSILGAKALECTVSVILIGLFFFGLGALDIKLLFDQFGEIESLMAFFKQLLATMRMNVLLDPMSIAIFVIETVASWIEMVMVAFLADVIATALLKGKKFGGLLAFAFFIALASLTGKIIKSVPTVGTGFVPALVTCGVVLVIAAVECVVTATIMEKKLSV